MVAQVHRGDRRSVGVRRDAAHDEDAVREEEAEVCRDPRDRDEEHHGGDPDAERVEREPPGDLVPGSRPRRDRQRQHERDTERRDGVHETCVEIVLVDDARPGDDGAEGDRRPRHEPCASRERVDRDEREQCRDDRHREVELDEHPRQPPDGPVARHVVQVVGRGAGVGIEAPVRHEDHREHDRPHRPGGERLALRCAAAATHAERR